MALVIANRVQETTTTTGTGTVTLAGAVAGFQSFAIVGDANTTYYTITSGNNWEVGIGTYASSGTTLARTTILSSSIGGGAITLAGTSTVFSSYPAEKAISDGYGLLPVPNGGTGAATLTGVVKGNGASAFTAGTVALGSEVSGTLPVANGGTGATTLSGVIKGNGTSAMTAGTVSLTSEVTGTLPLANGGTGITAVGTTGNVLTSTGSAWVSQAAGGGANVQSFVAGGTWTKPPGAKFVMVEVWGAGGGGRGGITDPSPGPANSGGSGGGGGGYSYAMFVAGQLGATETVTVGAGGPGGSGPATPTSSPAKNGGTGGTSNFGTHLYGGGGNGTTGNGGWSFAPGAEFQAYTTPTQVIANLTHQIHGGVATLDPPAPVQVFGTFGGGIGGFLYSQAGGNSMFGGGGGGRGAPGGGVFGFNGGRRSGGAVSNGGATAGQPGAPLGYYFGGGGGNGAPVGASAGGAGGVAAGGGGGGGGAPGLDPGYPGGNGGSGLVLVYTW